MPSSSGAAGSPLGDLGTLVSYPNLALSKDPAASPSAAIRPDYLSTPAPMGLSDFGVGAGGAYSYNTTHFQAAVTLHSPPNVTAPNSEAVIDPTASHLGEVGSPYEFSLQLNTVLTNVTIPGTNNGVFWTQNVLDINDTAIHFVDDVWNISTDSGFVIPTGSPATLVSGCGLTDLTTMLSFGEGVYQCVGGSVALSATADFPLTIQLYNNASVTAADQDQVQFGYRIVGNGHLLGTGISDTVVFNNPNGTHVPPAHPVAFEVNGFSRAPPQTGGLPRLLEDSEVTFGGPIGGTNAVFRSMNASVALEFANGSGPWTSIPSAYNFGDDTGETAVGLAGTWQGTTETLLQGPSFLYGLWHGPASDSVASGSIGFSGSVSPNYGFVFVSNVAPGTNGKNLSYVPTTATGTFSTELPPAVPAGGGPYFTELYAAGFTPENGSKFTSTQSAYAFPTPTANPTIEAPLYMLGEAQAAQLATNVVGWSSGPYRFSNLTVNLPLPFTHLNGYLFPSFVIFQAEGLTTVPVYVSNVTEGSNSPIGGENYTSPLTGPFGPLFNFTAAINIFGSTDALLSDETFYGPGAYSLPSPPGRGVGGVAFLFGDAYASVYNVTAEYGSYGVANELSFLTEAFGLTALDGGLGLYDVGSFGTLAWNVTSTDDRTIGVWALDSWFPSASWLNTSDDAYGYVSGIAEIVPLYYAASGSYGATVAQVNATDDALAVIDSFSAYDQIEDVTTTFASGVAVGWSVDTTIADLVAMPDDGGFGVDLIAANSTLVADTAYELEECDDCYGAELTFANGTTFEQTTIDQSYTLYYGYEDLDLYSYGIWAIGSNDLTITGTVIDQGLAYCYAYDNVGNYGELEGIVVLASNDTTVTGTTITQAYALCGQEYGVDNGAEFLGVAAGLTNHTVISGTTVYQNFSASYLYEAYDNSVEFLGAAAVFSNESTIESTTVVENYSLDHLYDAWDNNVQFSGAVAEFVNYTTVTGTTTSENLTLEDLSYASENSPSFYGVAVSSANFTMVTRTTVSQNFSVNNVEDEVYGNEPDFYAVAVESANSTVVTATTVDQQFSIFLIDGEVYDNDGYFYGVYGQVTDGFTVSTTAVEQNFTILDVDEVYDNDGTFVGVAADEGSNLKVSDTTGSQSYFAWDFGEVYGDVSSFDLAYVVDENGVTDLGTSAAQAYAFGDVYEYYSDYLGEFVGTYVGDSRNVSLTGTYVNSSSDYEDTAFYGTYLTSAIDATVSTVVASTTLATWDSGATLDGVYAETATELTVRGVTATGGFAGVWVDPSSDVTISQIDATNGSLGVGLDDAASATVTDVSATNLSVGVIVEDSTGVQIASVTASDLSGGVWVFESSLVTVSGVTASNTTSSSPWNDAFENYWGNPEAAVLTADSDQVDVSNVVATDYPAALIDFSSGHGGSGPGGLIVQDVTATGGAYLAVLDGTENSVLTDLDGSHDVVGLALSETQNDYFGQVTAIHGSIGVWVYEAEDDSFTVVNASNDGVGMATGSDDFGTDNQVWSSTFANDSGFGVNVTNGCYNLFWLNTFANDGSYGVYLWSSYGNTIWDNSFIGDNGATATYDPSHIQAYTSTSDNAFNSEADLGNYWADWHTYTSAGVLAPYYVGSGDWDYYPIGYMAGEYEVVFSESGLESGAVWSVTFNGVTETTTNAELTFGAPAGTYDFTVTAPAGYTATPASGSVMVPLGASDVVTIAFRQVFAVTVTESGLAAGTSWSVVVGGVTGTSTSSSVTVELPSGTYTYQVLTVPGYSASPSGGSLTVASAPYVQAVVFTPEVYAATVTETGLPAGTSWSVIVDGVAGTSTTPSISIPLPAGSYGYTVLAVPGYTASTTSGTLVVASTPSISLAVSFSPELYTVTVTESGLASGTTWGAVVDGVLDRGTTSLLTFSLPAGTYTYEIAPVANYSVSSSAGTLTVTSLGANLVVAFSEVRYAATFSETGLSAGTSWSVTVDGTVYSTSSSSITVELGNGSFAFAFGNVSGYSLTTGSGHLVINGYPAGEMVTYSATVTPSYVGKGTFNGDLALALGLAAVAIVVALVALLRKPRAPAPPPPATQWQEPPAGPAGGGVR